MDQVPMLIQSGYKALTVFMDMWHMAQTLHKNVAEAREKSLKMLEDTPADSNGEVKEPVEQKTAELPLNGKKD